MVDPVPDLCIWSSLKLVFMQLTQAVQHQAAAVRTDTGRIAQIQHGILGCAEQDALMLRWQKAAAPKV